MGAVASRAGNAARRSREQCRPGAARTFAGSASRRTSADQAHQFRDGLLHRGGLRGEFLGGGGGFLGARSHFLAHVLDLEDGAVHLLDATGLLLAGGGDVGVDLLNLAGAFRHDTVLLVGFVDETIAGVDTGDGGLDQLRSVLGGIGGALGKVADLVGDHGEAGALLPQPGGFDGRVQCQYVGLKRDFVNGADDLARLFAGLLYLADGGDDGAHLLVTLVHQPARGLGDLARFGRPFAVAAGHRGQLVQICGRFLHRSGLTAGAAGEVLAGGRYLTRSALHLVGGIAQRPGQAAGRRHDSPIEIPEDDGNKNSKASQQNEDILRACDLASAMERAIGT